MTHIFISYRRDDTATVSGRIYDRLVDTFGRAAVFKDVDNIPIGVNFADHIAKVIEQCVVQLVVIGPRWFDAADAQGQRRLDNPKDFVRLEIEAALRRGIPIIPLLVDGAPPPPVDRLPSAMRTLPLQNGALIRAADFDRDIGKVTAHLAQSVKPLHGGLSNPGRSLTGTGLLFGIELAAIYTVVSAVGALMVNGASNTSMIVMLFVAVYLAPALIFCYLAGRAAALRGGRVLMGVWAGLITAVLGSVVGGAVFGALVQTPAAFPHASGDTRGGALSGLMIGLILALVIGPTIGALGGLAGRTNYQKATPTFTRPR
jgi:TIR domain